MSKQGSTTHVKKYLLFERSTGRIVGTHSLYDAGQRSYSHRPLEEVRAIFAGSVPARTAEIFEILEQDVPHGLDVGSHYIDVKARKLVPKAQLNLKPERTQLQGDGKDTIELQITVVDHEGKALGSFSGELQVSTTRGKLSAPGGRVKASKGRASIKLTSAVETVDKVSITVRDPNGRCAQGFTTVEFL